MENDLASVFLKAWSYERAGTGAGGAAKQDERSMSPGSHPRRRELMSRGWAPTLTRPAARLHSHPVSYVYKISKCMSKTLNNRGQKIEISFNERCTSFPFLHGTGIRTRTSSNIEECEENLNLQESFISKSKLNSLFQLANCFGTQTISTQPTHSERLSIITVIGGTRIDAGLENIHLA